MVLQAHFSPTDQYCKLTSLTGKSNAYKQRLVFYIVIQIDYWHQVAKFREAVLHTNGL